MNLTDKFDGSALPFEGDLAIAWSSLPVGAKISKATITLKSVPPPSGTLFNEVISIHNGAGDWGTTVTTGVLMEGAAKKRGYAEIDFHRRRTLVSIATTGFSNAALQVDVGGMYVKINSTGAISSPGDADFSLQGDALPSLTVSKFRLISQSLTEPSVLSIKVRSTPSNLAVKLGNSVPVWNRLGDLTDQDTSPDFTPLLQKLLATAEIAHGFYAVPVSIHSDTVARFEATLHIDYLQQSSMLPDGVKEVVLPFDYGSTPKADPMVLTAKLPPNARVAAQATSAKVMGSFAETRVLYGPTGDVAPAASVNIAPNDAQAQLFSIDSSDSADSLDLYISPESPGGTVSVDLRGDLDGKPDSASLLAAPVQADLASRADDRPTWLNVPFAAPFPFQKDKKYWLVFQSLAGTFAWSVVKGTPGKAVLQHSQDGGLSWRETPAPATATPPSGLFRLRHKPAIFKVPIELQVGVGTQAQRVSLDRFQALGRVDFDLGIPEVARGFNQYLATSAQSGCLEVEHLANGNFAQWTVVGNSLSSASTPDAVPANTSVLAMAMSSDGKSCYVAVKAPPTGGAPPGIVAPQPSYALLTIDVACQTASPDRITWSANDDPVKLLLHPDGNHIFILGKTGTVLLGDLSGGTVTALSDDHAVRDLCFSPDGLNLYVLSADRATDRAQVYLLGANDFARVFGDAPSASWRVAWRGSSGKSGHIVADSRFLYLATTDTDGGVTFLDANTLQAIGARLPIGQSVSSIAVTPDGTTVLATNDTERSIALIKMENRTFYNVFFSDASAAADTNLRPLAVAVAPDSTRAFVALQSTAGAAPSGNIGTIDLQKRVAQPVISIKSAPNSVAIAPQGDTLFVGSSGSPALTVFDIGTRTPADWFLTSGQLQLRCVPQISNAHVVAFFGDLDDATSGPLVRASAFSQVAPVTGGCAYLFRFEGLAADPDAVAEILWRGTDCGAQKTDSLAIPQVPANHNAAVVPPPQGASPAAQVSRRFPLVKTSGRFVAPPAATAAEVRFTALNGKAAVAAVSLVGSREAVQNGSLESLQQGVPDQWQLSSSMAQGFVVSPAGLETILRNNGAGTNWLKQQLPVTAKKNFKLQFDGKRLPGGADDPAVEVHWLKDDGTEAGTAIVEKFPTASFEKHPISGLSPDDAAKAEVRLTLPSKTALAVSAVSLQFPQLAAIPISFIAQSPGELRISGAKVGFDTPPPAPPLVPPTGLCPPTPPGQQPGQQPRDACHCPCCGGATLMSESTPALTPAGRPAMLGACRNCGSQIVRGGGTLVSGAPKIPFRTVTHDVEVSRAPLSGIVPAAPPVLTDIMGIGKARAQKLRNIGIKSVSDLAKADPADVAHALRGVSVENAAILIRHAKKVLQGDSRTTAF